MSLTNIEVKLIGEDGNAFAILGKVQRAMRRNNVPNETIDKMMEEATSGDYNHLLNTVAEYVTII